MAPGAVPTTQGDDDDDDGESANFYDTELTGDANEPVISDPEWKTVERPDHVALFVITPLNDWPTDSLSRSQNYYRSQRLFGVR